MYIAQTTKDRIKALSKAKKINIETMLNDCSLGINAVRQISDSKGMASFSLAAIADYLDCSVDYLLGRADIPDAIYVSDTDVRNGTNDYIMTSSRSETTLLIEFRGLNSQGQDYILQTMDMVKDKYKKSDSVSRMEEIG